MLRGVRSLAQGRPVNTLGRCKFELRSVRFSGSRCLCLTTLPCGQLFATFFCHDPHDRLIDSSHVNHSLSWPAAMISPFFPRYKVYLNVREGYLISGRTPDPFSFVYLQNSQIRMFGYHGRFQKQLPCLLAHSLPLLWPAACQLPDTE